MIGIAQRMQLAVLAFAACLAPVAQGAFLQWSTGGPTGVGPINTVAVDPVNPLTLYAGSGADGALSKTTDGGATWNPASTNLPTAGKTSIAIDPSNTNIVYVGVSGVWKSINGGASWTDVSNNNGMIVKSVRAVAIDPSNPNVLYASTSGVPPNTIYRSPDGGGQWFQRSNGLPASVGIVGVLTIDPTNPATIYAGTQSGVFKTIDSGANWVAINTGFDPDPSPSINAVVVDPHNPSTVYVGTGGFGVWKSTNGGESWTRTSTGFASSLINALVIDPRNTNVLYAGTGSSGVYRTTDAAANWAAFNNGLTANTIPALAINFSGSCVYAGTNVNGASGQVFDFTRVAGCGEPPNYQGLWWNSPASSESGWGINLAHQNDTIFMTWFTYDLAGKPWWLAVTAEKTAEHTYSGNLFVTTGPPFNAVPFDPAQVTETTVGTATFTFTDLDNGTFDYTVNVPGSKVTAVQSKSITRQLFAEPVPTCIWGAQTNLALASNYQDLWWKSPASSESGWGINFTHQGDLIFATWFTYDLAGKPWWLAIVAAKAGDNVYTGDLFTTVGPPFNAVPFNPSLVVETTVGTGAFTVIDGNTVQFDYTVNGVTQSKTLTRQVFVAPGTACSVP
jgi:photosystem II stability/assembly factor-like uncharacterized protein